MTDNNVAELLRVHVADGPPMGLTSSAVIAAGRRSRRQRRLLGAACALVAAVTVTSAAFAWLPAGGGTAPPATSPAATCADLEVPSPSPPGAGPSPARADPDPAALAAARQVSCYLRDVLPALLPNATFAANPARPGTAALVAVPGGMGGGDLEVTATALVSDQAGTGLVIVAVSRQAAPTAAQVDETCTAPTAKAQCRTGANGEHIEIYDAGVDPNGAHGITVYVYSGHTFILAGARNTGETQDSPPSRPEPPLTVDQLITVATAPAVKLYP
jgi:hypothetical protein